MKADKLQQAIPRSVLLTQARKLHHELDQWMKYISRDGSSSGCVTPSIRNYRSLGAILCRIDEFAARLQSTNYLRAKQILNQKNVVKTKLEQARDRVHKGESSLTKAHNSILGDIVLLQYELTNLVIAESPHNTQRVPWDDEASEYLHLSEIHKLVEGRLSLPTLSKLLTPDGNIRYMRKRGYGAKAHITDFRKYAKNQLNDPKWAKAYLDYREAMGKGDLRWFNRCKGCGYEYAENATAPTECPNCKKDIELVPKAPPKPHR